MAGCEPEDLERAAAAAPTGSWPSAGTGRSRGAAELALRRDIPLGVIPGGTANDFVRAAGLPLDPVEAAALAARGTELRRFELAGSLTGGRSSTSRALGSRPSRRAARRRSSRGWARSPTRSARPGRR